LAEFLILSSSFNPLDKECVCHGVFPAKDLAGVGRLLLDELRLCAALGARAKNLNTVYFFMKRFNKI